MSQKNSNALSKTHRYLLKKLRDNKIFQIYKKFENNLKLKQNFIVAVSGGPDSLALAFLTKIYSIKNSLSVKYFIVDHRLRKTSSSEVKLVDQLLSKHNIKLHVLKWKGIKPKSNIQSLAREKRYSLLINQAKKFNIKNILVGHHIDDLYENFFLRISRGVGLNGLVSFKDKTTSKKINILRPLIYFEKKDLIYISNNVFKSYINDPSNVDKKFKRTRIRNLINSLQMEGFDKKKFLLTLKNLSDSNQTINFYIEKNLRENSFFNKKKNQVILAKEFFKQPHEIIFRSLTNIIKHVGNKYYSPRGKKVVRLISILKNENNIYFKLTLGNCIIYKVNNSVIVAKEQ